MEIIFDGKFCVGLYFYKLKTYEIENQQMTINEKYPTKSSSNHLLYAFNSLGKKGKITKIVTFQKTDEGPYNLAFGDWKNGDIDDEIVTNNHDILKVMSTVASIIYDFFIHHPYEIISIEAVDEKRLKLYNAIFKRRVEEIVENFEVTGFIGNAKEKYNPKRFYNKFEIKKK